MVESLALAANNAARGTKYWAYAAWTLPFVALALIIFSHFIGTESLIQRTMVTISITFFAFSVYWWWWALNRLAEITAAMRSNDDRFEEVASHIKEAKELIREYENNVGNR